jgi:thiol peroxidase
MAKITLKGNPIHSIGELPKIGSTAPDFLLVAEDLSNKGLGDFSGKKKILNIVPSLDTAVCAASARRFNEEATGLGDTVVLNISADLPFAAKRFCEAEDLEAVKHLSTFRDTRFGESYGVRIVDGPMAGLMSRAVVVLDAKNKVVSTEQVPEIAQEPNYESALEALKNA